MAGSVSGFVADLGLVAWLEVTLATGSSLAISGKRTVNSDGRGAVKVLRMPWVMPVAGSGLVPGMVISSSWAWSMRRDLGFGLSP